MKNPFSVFYLRTLSGAEEIKRLSNRIEELERQLFEAQAAQVCTEQAEVKQAMTYEKDIEDHELEKRLKLIQGIIKFRDQLLLFRDNTEDEGTAKLISNLYREVGRILSSNGVEMLNRGGDFSPDSQVAADTIATDQAELFNKIESTFRDGYIFEGKMLRPQEVIVYVERR